MTGKNSSIHQDEQVIFNERVEYLRSVLESFIGEDSAGCIIIGIFDGTIKTHDEFYRQLKHYGKISPTNKLDGIFDIHYVGSTIFPDYIFEELKHGIINSKNTIISEKKIEKTQSKWRRLWIKIFGV